MSGTYEDHETEAFTALRIEEPCDGLMVGSFLKRTVQPIEKCLGSVDTSSRDDSPSQGKDENAVDFGYALACSGMTGYHLRGHVAMWQLVNLDIEFHLKIHAMYNKILLYQRFLNCR
jgi:hypothetical protein